MAKLALSFILSKVKGNKWQTFPGIGAPIPRVEVQLSSLHVSCEACLSVCMWQREEVAGKERSFRHQTTIVCLGNGKADRLLTLSACFVSRIKLRHCHSYCKSVTVWHNFLREAILYIIHVICFPTFFTLPSS